MGRSKSYSKELKEEILGKLREGQSLRKTSEAYGIAPSTISTWLSRSAEGEIGEELKIGKLQKENEALYKILGRLTYEQELLKNRRYR